MQILSKIIKQPLSMVICCNLICQNCGIIDSNLERMNQDYSCSTCGEKSSSGRIHYPISTHILIDLLQQAFHSESPTTTIPGPQGSDVGTILYFCSLRESLLNTLLENHLHAQQVPDNIIKKLLTDNKLASEKFGGLFTTAFGVKWEIAISEVSRISKHDYAQVADLMKRAAKMRNEFLHQGIAWPINRESAEECINSTGHLISLFVNLHNIYTHPILFERSRKAKN